MQRRGWLQAVDPVISAGHGSRGAGGGADCVASDEFHDARNILADTSEEDHGRDDDIRRFDPSSAYASQGHKEDTSGEGEEAQGRGIRKAAVIYRHPRLAAIIGGLGLETCRGAYVILFT